MKFEKKANIESASRTINVYNYSHNRLWSGNTDSKNTAYRLDATLKGWNRYSSWIVGKVCVRVDCYWWVQRQGWVCLKVVRLYGVSYMYMTMVLLKVLCPCEIHQRNVAKWNFTSKPYNNIHLFTTVIGTDSLSMLMCLRAVNQSIN